ncbi:MAG: hypothetical protein H0U29_03910 [Acidimicrobiia bacterium]|nr:hypothetical protein [Acidimicrobiia bacterium]
MPAWTCPNCQRRFARRGQGHECAPAMTVEEYFATGPPFERPVFEAVLEALRPLGPIHVEPVSVGIFLKRAQTFAQLRPMTRWVTLSFSLRREVRHPLITRKVIAHGGRYFHVVKLTGPDDLDEQIVDWLTEAYADAPD